MNNTRVNLPTTAGQLRPSGHRVNLIVIHAMSEYIQYVDDKHYHASEFLNLKNLSCHYMISPGGTVINCSDPEKHTAWHARSFNHHSIGIELLVPGLNDYETFENTMKNKDWINNYQQDALLRLCVELMIKFGMKSAHDQIKLHCELDPKRKVDPGYMFNWDLLKHIVQNLKNHSPLSES